MKKNIGMILIGLQCIFCMFAKSNLDVQKDGEGNIVIGNISNDIEDRIRLINETSETINFEIYLKKTEDSSEVLFSKTNLRSKDTEYQKSSYNGSLDKFEYVIIKTTNGTIDTFNTEVKHDDLIFTVSAFSVKESKPKIPIEMFNFTYSADIKNIEYAFANAKIWIAESFNSAKSVIQMEDKDSGVIIGKGKDVYQFTFKIKLRGNKASVQFYDYDVKHLYIFGDEKECEDAYEFAKLRSEKMSKSLFYTIEND